MGLEISSITVDYFFVLTVNQLERYSVLGVTKYMDLYLQCLVFIFEHFYVIKSGKIKNFCIKQMLNERVYSLRRS